MIGGEQLRQLAQLTDGPRTDLFARVLDDALAEGGITTPRRIGHFLAQIAVETGGFRSLVESTGYRDAARLFKIFRNVQSLAHAERLIGQGAIAIGNTIYAHKNGNGDVASGDGYRFRGRGFLQITGRANYRRIGALTGMPLEAEPERLGEPSSAARAAAIYWKLRNINDAADADDIGTVTLLVNGPARLHLAERADYLARAKAIWT